MKATCGVLDGRGGGAAGAATGTLESGRFRAWVREEIRAALSLRAFEAALLAAAIATQVAINATPVEMSVIPINIAAIDSDISKALSLISTDCAVPTLFNRPVTPRVHPMTRMESRRSTLPRRSFCFLVGKRSYRVVPSVP